MAIKEFPNVSPDANATFGLEENTTEFNSVLTKTAQHMTLPGAKWRGSVSFTNRSRQEANKVKAFKAALGGKAGRFYLTPFDAYQNGTMSGAGVIDGAVSSGASSLPTTGWDADQDTLFEFGDYIEVNGELKMVTGDVSAPQSYIEYIGTNVMTDPFNPSEWYGSTSDPDGTITNTTIANPSGQSFVGLAEQTGANVFQLTASGQDNFLAGETAWSFVLCKNINDDSSIQFFYNGTNLPSRNVVVRISDGAIVDGALAAGMILQRIDLGDGFFLISIERVLEGDEVVDCRQYLRDSSGAVPSIGSQLYVQAAYFGKADGYPAQLLATADISIAPPLRKALTGGESITVDSPKGKFYLGSDSQEWSINVNGVQDMGFDFIEDIN